MGRGPRASKGATLGEIPSSGGDPEVDTSVARQDSQWKGKDSDPPIEPQAQNVSC